MLMSLCPIKSRATVNDIPALCKSVANVCRKQYNVRSDANVVLMISFRYTVAPRLMSIDRQNDFHQRRNASSSAIPPFGPGNTYSSS